MRNSKPQAYIIQLKPDSYIYNIHDHIATNSMVSKVTRLAEEILSRFKHWFDDSGLLFELYKDYCKHTHHPATCLRTNKTLISKI